MGNRARFKATVKEANNIPEILRGKVGVVKDCKAINDLTEEYVYLFEYEQDGKVQEKWIPDDNLDIE